MKKSYQNSKIANRSCSYKESLYRRKTKERNTANQNLSKAQVIVATGKYIGEGFDLPRLDTLFITLPISWKGTLAQYAGRIHRSFQNKDEVQIYDYVEVNVVMLNLMYQKREKGYLALGYEIIKKER